jgi:anaerobic glycerol-3-phosphate dehydrogenase C subunit
LTDDIRALESDLRRRIFGDVRFDAYSRAMYSTDASIYQIQPIGVVIPRDLDDVVGVISSCSDAGVAVLPRGGGTSLAGQTVNYAVVLDFSKYMNRIREVNPNERWVRAEPGITLDELNNQLRVHGLHFPPDPSTSNRATVGGAIGNNSCGSHSVVYGKTVDHVKELEVVLSDGSSTRFKPLEEAALDEKLARKDLEGRVYNDVISIAAEHRDQIAIHYPKIMRRVSGYNLDMMLETDQINLSSMVVGSEGTLVAVAEAKLNLESMPKFKGLGVLHFERLIEAMEATINVLEHNPSAVELMDSMIIERCRESLGFARRITFLEGNPNAVLLVEFFGESLKEVESKIDALKQDMQRRGLGFACVVAMNPEDQANVWAVRSAGLGLLMSVVGDTKPLPFVEDTAVAPEMLPEYVRRFDEIVRHHDTVAAYYGHASFGCLHIRPMVNIKLEEGLDKLISISNQVAELVLEFGGSLSGEHGDGIVRGVWNEKMFGSKLYSAFRDVKRSFDPIGIMNPGKIVDCPPITENLRLGPGYQAIEPSTVMDFSSTGGFARSIEMCSGLGACRKTLGGTMCPSYMVTLDEEHSTRGRANALRSVLTGALPTSEFNSRRLYDVLDLCLACKGCKAECPSNVDMAKIKYEFLHHYYKHHWIPLRMRFFSNIATVNRLISFVRPLANSLIANNLIKWVMDKLLKIDKRRNLPLLAKATFATWFKKRGSKPNYQGNNVKKGQVVLFHDTFMNYNEPQVGRAMIDLLEAAGFHVTLADKVCCGRPMISNGMLEKARQNAKINVDKLYPHARNGVPIIGAEPSCLLTLRDEYPDLLLTHESKVVAENSFLIEEFLVKLHNDGQLNLRFKETPERVLFHGHCHQKALTGTRASIEALKLVPGLQIDEVDAGCCGMAGAFGYEKEHYEMSMAIGERRLFPSVRSAVNSRIAITGVSCRSQVRDGTGRRPEHVVEILRDALVE